MRHVSIAELRHHLAAWLRRVEQGERLAIQRRDQVIAELRPPPGRRGEAARVPMVSEPAAAWQVPEEGGASPLRDAASRVKLFDDGTRRQRERERANPVRRGKERGWTREDLYDRGRPR